MSSKGASFPPLPIPPHRPRSHSRVRRKALAGLLARTRCRCASQLCSPPALSACISLTQGCPDPVGSRVRCRHPRQPSPRMGADNQARRKAGSTDQASRKGWSSRSQQAVEGRETMDPRQGRKTPKSASISTVFPIAFVILMHFPFPLHFVTSPLLCSTYSHTHAPLPG